MGRGWPPDGIAVPTASVAVAITNKNMDFISCHRRESCPEPSPGPFTAWVPPSTLGYALAPALQSRALRLGGHASLSKATQRVRGEWPPVMPRGRLLPGWRRES